MILAIFLYNLMEFCPANSEISISFWFNFFETRDLNLQGHGVGRTRLRLSMVYDISMHNMVRLSEGLSELHREFESPIWRPAAILDLKNWPKPGLKHLLIISEP
jgi:hypothetical protein